MRVTTEQLKGGWRHPHRVVRNVVASHFTDIFTTDPDVTAHAIRGAQEYGWERFLTWGYRFARLPLADDAALDWVCGEIERTDEGAPSARLKAHLAKMLAAAEIAVVERHRSRLLSLPSLQPMERQALLTRLELVQCSPAESWRRLEDHCRMAAAGATSAEARIPEAKLLLEPLERDESESVARVLNVLRNPPPQGDGDDPAEWLTGLMITLAGRFRIEEAAPLIWDLLAVDWDWYEGEALEALKRIGTPSVVQLARERYQQAGWDTRLDAVSVFAAIRCDESAAAIEEAVAGEKDDDLRSSLGVAAAAHLDDRLVPLALAVFHENPEDPERLDILEQLVAFSHLSGQELPGRDEWERDVDEYDDRMIRLADPAESPLAELLLEQFDDEDEDDVDLGERIEHEEAAETPIHRGAQVGRNAPCPCGSGKKYKRCCLSGGHD